eukprot:scaffold32202_cov45-Isochrysis_galbana.AAC.1
MSRGSGRPTACAWSASWRPGGRTCSSTSGSRGRMPISSISPCAEGRHCGFTVNGAWHAIS